MITKEVARKFFVKLVSSKFLAKILDFVLGEYDN